MKQGIRWAQVFLAAASVLAANTVQLAAQTSSWSNGYRLTTSFSRYTGWESEVPNSGWRTETTNIFFAHNAAATFESDLVYDPLFVQTYHTSRVRVRYTWPWNGSNGWNPAVGETLVTTQPFPGVPYYEQTITYPHTTPTDPLFATVHDLPLQRVSQTLIGGQFPGTIRRHYYSSSQAAVVNFRNTNGQTWVKTNPNVSAVVLGTDFKLYPSGSALTAGQITVNGEGLNCDGEHVVEVAAEGITGITVDNTIGVTSFSFGINPQLPKHVQLSRAFHPSFPFDPELSALQSLFDTGSRNRLAQDADGCVVSGGREDDVETYIEFDVIDGDPVEFPAPWSAPSYFVITDISKMYNLANSGVFAFVKQVQQLPTPFDGYSGPGSIVLDAWSNDAVAVHEWVHTKGVLHRGSPGNPDVGGNTNTAANTPAPDPEALMCSTDNGSQNEVNRTERQAILAP